MFAIAVAFLCSSGAAEQPPVTIVSPCECHDNHGKGRWDVKNDPSTPPINAGAIQAVTPSDVFGWPGPGEQLTWQSKRTGRENNWYSVTGRIVAVKVEADGDLHIALADATGDKPGIVVCEVPSQPQWCEIRTTVFGCTRTRFPLHVRSTRKLTLNEAPVVTLIGKAFWDIGHAPKDQSNRRSHLPGYAAWEIHPVMALRVDFASGPLRNALPAPGISHGSTKSAACETLPVHRSFDQGNDTGPKRTGESICKNLPLQEVLGSAARADSQYR